MLNQFYEWPKTRMEYNIFFREVFRLPDFWRELGRKLVFGAVSFGVDTGSKLAVWQFIYGGTWSPAEFADNNAFKYVFCALIATIPTCWTGVPFAMA